MLSGGLGPGWGRQVALHGLPWSCFLAECLVDGILSDSYPIGDGVKQGPGVGLVLVNLACESMFDRRQGLGSWRGKRTPSFGGRLFPPSIGLET